MQYILQIRLYTALLKANGDMQFQTRMLPYDQKVTVSFVHYMRKQQIKFSFF